MNVKKLSVLFFAFIAIGGNQLSSQELLPVMYDSTLANNQITLNGNAFHQSSAFSNEISRKLIFGGEITDEMSQKTFEQHKDFNRIGGGARFRISYKSAGKTFKSKPNWSWMIDASNEIHASSSYTGDFVGLALLGNASFLGESLLFSNSSVEFVQYLSVGGGIHDRKTKNFVSINAVLPQNYFQLYINKGSVSFSEDGGNIDVRLQGEMLEALSSPYFKGIGAALNFDFNIPFGNNEAFNGIIKFSARNLGAYHLNDAVFQEVDSNISYSGFAIDDFTSDSEMANLKDTLGLTESNRSSTKLLPGFIQVGKVASVHSNNKLQSTFGVRMYTNIVYRPMVYVGLHYQPHNHFSLGSQASFGGYGNFRLGLYANYTGQNIMIGLGTEDVLGAILKSQFGQSGLIRLAWKF